MSSAPDLLIQELIETWIGTIKARLDYIDAIFSDLSTGQRTKIKSYITAVDLDVRLGWTQHGTKMPCIAITLPGEQEAQQYIGSEPGEALDTLTDQWVPSSYVDRDVNRYLEVQKTQFSGAVDAAVYALNATETTWLVNILKWILLINREPLEDAGLTEQRVSVTDFMPAPDYPQPDPAYTRVCKLQFVNYQVYTPEHTDPDDLLYADEVAVINLEDT